ncbi:MAG: nucleotidyltransferase family protein [Planctomycetes bacterium]|nr:nucleotidyltransferase family protein [Planctomycetota bacterium]
MDRSADRVKSLPRERIAAFCKQHGIRRLAVFGSFLREDFSPESDLDVLVEFEPGARTGFAFIGMQDELAEIVGRPVDLNTFRGLSRYFRERVLAEAQDVYVAA